MNGEQEDRYLAQIRMLKAEVRELTETLAEAREQVKVLSQIGQELQQLDQWREVGRNLLPDLYGVDYDRVTNLLAKSEAGNG